MTYVEPRLLTFRHWAGVSPYTSPFGLAETCVFGKQSPEPLHCGPQGLRRKTPSPHGHPFSRSYRANLSSSLTRVLPFTLGLLPLPTCFGLRYGLCSSSQRSFSWWLRFSRIPPGIIPGVFTPLSSGNGFAYPPRRLQGQTRHVQWARPAYLPTSLLWLKRNNSGAGILTCCPSPSRYATA